jgi:hypothetical protein
MAERSGTSMVSPLPRNFGRIVSVGEPKERRLLTQHQQQAYGSGTLFQ